MRQTHKCALWMTLVCIWMAVIFFFSAKPATQSQQTSDGIVDLLISLLIPDFEGLSAARQGEIAATFSTLVRKGAHLFEFALLSALSYLTLRTCQRPRSTALQALIAWGFAALYAMTDEVHQLFVPGRAGRLTDVLIDSTGALLGVAIAYFLAHLWDRRKSKQTADR